MKIIKGDIPGLLIFEPVKYRDSRGSFMETYNSVRMAELGFHEKFVQDNESVSQKGVIRALHFQNPPMAQGKLVRVVKGAVIDVAVDIRKGSPWYGKYQKIILSEDNQLLFWLPPGFAHGFAALENDTVFHYKCTNKYSQPHEGAIRWNDPELGIDWMVEKPMVSDRDASAPEFRDHPGIFTFEASKGDDQ
jgi:dTDP-4-dehydrorhamnose 3,5-epimerase